MLKRIFFGFCVLALAWVPGAQAMALEIGVGTANRAPAGTVQYMTGGTNADLKNDLNLGDHSDLVGRLKLKHPIPIIPNIYIHYLPMSFTGDKTSTSSIIYGGQTFQASTALHTELTLNAIDLGLFYDIPFISTATGGIVVPEIGLNVRMLSFSGKLTGTTAAGTRTEEKTASIPVPMLYLGLGIHPIKFISLNAEIKTLSVGGNSITDWGVEAAIHPLPVLYVAVGYISQSIKIDTDNIKTDISFKGPYAAVGVSF